MTIDEFEEFKEIIRAEYNELFTKIFPKNTKKAKVLVLLNEPNTHSGYCKGCNTIFLNQAEGNIEDIGIKGIEQTKWWPSWKGELVHEMVHEYQMKIEYEPTVEGVQLFEEFQYTPSNPKLSSSGVGFDGNGHDSKFYTGICIFSKILELSPHELKQNI